MLGASVRVNIVLARERQFVLRRRREAEAAARMIGELRVRTHDAERPVGELSGGNQQKVVLARWLLADASVFLLDEPTRGVDVAAKSEIYALIRTLAARGAAVLFAWNWKGPPPGGSNPAMHRRRIAELARGCHGRTDHATGYRGRRMSEPKTIARERRYRHTAVLICSDRRSYASR
jgi:ABC-type iron transport system FetAB ATPase subunit